VWRTIALFCAAARLHAAATDDPVGRTIDPLRVGGIEIGVAAGYGAGDVGGAKVDLPEILTYRVKGGGGTAARLHAGIGMWSRYQFVAEAAWMSGGRSSADLGNGTAVEARANAVVYDACVHIRFPTGSGRQFVPHLSLGAGSVQSRSDTLVRFTALAPTPGLPLDAATQVRQREGSFAPLAGVGAQVYLARKRVGFSFEAKSFFPTGTSHTPFVQMTVGVLTWVR